MNTCITALLSWFSPSLSDLQLNPTHGSQSRKKTSFVPGLRAESLSQLAIASALFIAAPFSFGQVKAVTSMPAPKTGASEMLPAIQSNPVLSPKSSTHSVSLAATTAKVAAVTLTEYSVDGTNSGTARLGHNATFAASAVNVSSPTFTWSLQGAGTITSAGIYTAPASMPSNTAVTIKATLASNTAVTGTYSLQLIYSAPAIQWVTPSTLLSGETNSVLVGGSYFTAATTVTVGGVSVPAVFNGTNGVVAQIPVAAGATAPLSIVASNPTPGGSSSVAASAAVKAPTMTLIAYSVDGTNSGTARLGRNVTLSASVQGMTSPSLTWSVQGAGTVTSAGVYTAPTTMPSNGAVTITAKLASNTAVSASYALTLIYTAPAIQWVIPSTLFSGQTNSVLIGGTDFTAATTVKVGGSTVPVVFQAPNQVLAQISIPAGATSAVSIVASNPTPGGGSSAAVSAAVQAPAMTVTAYSVDGTNTGTARLGRNVTLDAAVAGKSNATVNWSVQGAGTITTAGIYTAPTAMPSNGTVTITAKLASNATVSASYTLALIYTAPLIRWVVPASLVSGETNAIAISGSDFTAATTITVNGTAVPSVFNGSNGVLAQIPVAAGSLSAVSVIANNPTPGGGSSAAVSAPVTPLTIALSSFSTSAVNPASVSLGQEVQFAAVVSGGNPASSWPVTWSVQGAGSISSTGLYQSPTAIPSNATVTVTATLASNTSVTATASLSLLDPTPVVNRSQPVQATAGTTGTFTFYGENFNSATSILVNGQPVSTTYISPTSVAASVTTSQGATGSLSITAKNPAPNGGQSVVFPVSIGDTNAVWATIGTTPGRAIPGDFVGFSHEWGMQSIMGTAQTGVNNIYRQLVKNLTNPGTPFFIRIGGGSTDSTVEPTPTIVQAFSDLATAMPVRFSLGVNLAADSLQLSEDQASFFASHMPSGSIAAIELGNEPDNYPAAGVRSSTYDYTGYSSDVTKWDAGLAPLFPQNVKLVGPSFTTIWHLQEYLPTLEQ